MISRWIDWCAQNRFLVFTGTLLLVLAGIWSLRRIPLDALPDISDVQVIVHTPWAGQPPAIDPVLASIAFSPVPLGLIPEFVRLMPAHDDRPHPTNRRSEV